MEPGDEGGGSAINARLGHPVSSVLVARVYPPIVPSLLDFPCDISRFTTRATRLEHAQYRARFPLPHVDSRHLDRV